MTTFTTEDREAAAADKTPCVIPDRGASYIEPIPFMGMVEVKPEPEPEE